MNILHSTNKLLAALKFAAVSAFFIGAIAVQQAQSQASNFLQSRFFSSTITMNDKPLLAAVYFKNTQGNTVVQGMPLLDVIARVYGVQSYQIVDGPDWINTSHLYDIEAVPPPIFVESDENQMFKSLLSDKFNLDVHSSTREMPLLVLEQDGNSSKLNLATEDVADGILAYGLKILRSGSGEIAGSDDLDEFAKFLSRRFGQPIVSLINLEGRYAFELDGFVWGELDSLIEPLLEQMGLRLHLKVILVDVLIISKIERPILDD